MLFSHGSVLCGAGQALENYADLLRARGLAKQVGIGYLNYTQPLFADTVERCVQNGARSILVVPFFLVPGYFVKVDLPRAVSAVQEVHPELNISVAEPIGFDVSLADALIVAASQAVSPNEWRETRRLRPERCRAVPQCPLFGTPDCPKQPNPLMTEGEEVGK